MTFRSSVDPISSEEDTQPQASTCPNTHLLHVYLHISTSIYTHHTPHTPPPPTHTHTWNFKNEAGSYSEWDYFSGERDRNIRGNLSMYALFRF